MTQETAIGIAMGVAAVVFIIAIICNVKLTHLSWRVRFREKAKSRDCVTTGYYHKHRRTYRIEESNGNDFFHYKVTVKYKFTVNGKEYYTKVKHRYENENKNPHFDFPRQVTVYYDEARPKRAYAESRLTDDAAREEGVILIWLVSLGMGVAAYFLLYALFGNGQ